MALSQPLSIIGICDADNIHNNKLWFIYDEEIFNLIAKKEDFSQAETHSWGKVILIPHPFTLGLIRVREQYEVADKIRAITQYQKEFPEIIRPLQYAISDFPQENKNENYNSESNFITTIKHVQRIYHIDDDHVVAVIEES